MKFIKLYDSVNQAINTTEETPLVACVKNVDKVMFASDNKFGNSVQIVADGPDFIKGFITEHLLRCVEFNTTGTDFTTKYYNQNHIFNIDFDNFPANYPTGFAFKDSDQIAYFQAFNNDGLIILNIPYDVLAHGAGEDVSDEEYASWFPNSEIDDNGVGIAMEVLISPVMSGADRNAFQQVVDSTLQQFRETGQFDNMYNALVYPVFVDSDTMVGLPTSQLTASYFQKIRIVYEDGTTLDIDKNNFNGL